MHHTRHLAAAAATLLLVAACAEAPTAGPSAASPSFAAAGNGNENGNKFQCFSGTTDGPQEGVTYGGTCSYVGDGARLVTTDGDPDGSYAGVYLQNTNLDGKKLADVNKLAFSYSGTGASGGSPRFSIPIDTDGNGTWDLFAFIDTMGCNDGSANVGTLDAIGDATCTVALSNGPIYANWAAFAAANPTYRIASNTVSFIVQDQPGNFLITNIQIGKGPAKPAK